MNRSVHCRRFLPLLALLLAAFALACRLQERGRAEELLDKLSDDDRAPLNAAIEKLVQKSPEQYQWEYKRFKKPPPGTADPYK